MKLFFFLCLSLLLAWLYAPVYIFSQTRAAAPEAPLLTEATLEGRTVYFFVDSESDGTTLGPDFPAGKYWVVSRGVQSAVYEQHNDILANFRFVLRVRFADPGGLLDAQVFRFQFSQAEAEAERQALLESKREAGYQIIEIDFEQ
jgi:hypothetical protein